MISSKIYFSTLYSCIIVPSNLKLDRKSEIKLSYSLVSSEIIETATVEDTFWDVFTPSNERANIPNSCIQPAKKYKTNGFFCDKKIY